MSAARDKVIGSTIRNTEEMRRMVTEEPRTSLAVKVLVVRVELLIVPEVAPEHAQVVAELVLQVGEPETAQVVAGPERDPVAAEPELVRVAAEPELVRVVAELQLVRVVAVPQDRARNRRRVPAGPAAPTK
jgi:hypothetical protein